MKEIASPYRDTEAAGCYGNVTSALGCYEKVTRRDRGLTKCYVGVTLADVKIPRHDTSLDSRREGWMVPWGDGSKAGVRHSATPKPLTAKPAAHSPRQPSPLRPHGRHPVQRRSCDWRAWNLTNNLAIPVTYWWDRGWAMPLGLQMIRYQTLHCGVSMTRRSKGTLAHRPPLSPLGRDHLIDSPPSSLPNPPKPVLPHRHVARR